MAVPLQVLTITDARARLRELIASGSNVFIGARRRPEAVLMPMAAFSAGIVPARVLRTLLVSTAVGQAELIRREVDGRSSRVVHPGDPVGRLLAWLWTSGQEDVAMRWLADLVAELRVHQPNPVRPAITFDELLAGLAFAFPDDLEDRDRDALIDRARNDVPQYYGGDLNAPI